MEGGGYPDYPSFPKSSSAGVLTADSSSGKIPLMPLAPRGKAVASSPAAIAAANKSVPSGGMVKDRATVDDNGNNDNNGGNALGADAAAAWSRDQDKYMPIANVIRIMRKVLPTHAKIADDAKETIQECVSEYISFITGEANERCRREQRKTITAEDLLWAMSKLGFDDYIEPLTVYLQRYRVLEGDQRGSLRGDSLPPIKRTASDAGLYGPPPYLMGVQQPLPYVQQPPLVFPGATGFTSAAGGQGLQLPAGGGPVPLNYYMEMPHVYRDTLPATYREVPAYRDAPAPTYLDVPAVHRDMGGYGDVVGPSSSTQVTGPSVSHEIFPGFDPYASFK